MNHSTSMSLAALPSRFVVSAPAAIALAACLMFTPATARGDTLDNILDILVSAGVVDGAVKDAKPLVQCLISHDGDVSACVDVKSVAEQQGKQAVRKFTPTDPAIQSVVHIVQAANARDWVKVLELTGTDLLFQIVCKAGLSATGPVKNFVCSDTFNKVSGLAKAEVRQVLILVGDPTIGHLLALVEMNVSPDLACNITPKFPGKSEICGSLRELVKLGKDIANYAAKYGKDIWYGAGDVMGLNDPPAMSQEAYYALAWAPWYHKATFFCLSNNCRGPGKGGQDGGGIHDIEYNLWHSCKDYFASHDMTSSTAQSACDNMRDNKFVPHVKSFVKALPVAADAYVEVMRPLAKMWAVDDYGNNNAFTQNAAAFRQGCVNSLMTGLPFPAPNPPKQTPSPTAWAYACDHAAPKFALMLRQERSVIEQELPKLTGAGCHPPSGWTAKQGIHFTCVTYSGYQACVNALSAGKKKHCDLGSVKADVNSSKGLHEELHHAQMPGGPATPTGNPSANSRRGDVVLSPDSRARGVVPRMAPDLMVAGTAALIGHNTRKVVSWGGTVDVKADDAAVAGDGVCRFALHYDIRNGGAVASGPFRSVLGVGGGAPITHAHGALAPNARTSIEVMVSLKPGDNFVTLAIDTDHQAAGSNGNNTVHAAIRVNGGCGGASAGARRTPPGRLQLPVR